MAEFLVDLSVNVGSYEDLRIRSCENHQDFKKSRRCQASDVMGGRGPPNYIIRSIELARVNAAHNLRKRSNTKSSTKIGGIGTCVPLDPPPPSFLRLRPPHIKGGRPRNKDQGLYVHETSMVTLEDGSHKNVHEPCGIWNLWAMVGNSLQIAWTYPLSLWVATPIVEYS